jgi:hypothetical protein
MIRELIEKEVSAAKHAVDAVKGWVHPTTVMKRHEFDQPLDDLGQVIDDAGGSEPQEPGSPRAPRS